MEFLKEILGEELFNQVAEKINAHNGNEANKDAQIKLANLAGGEYVGKGKYDSVQTQLDESKTTIKTLTDSIEELKKGKMDADTLKSKISDMEKALVEAENREKETKIKYALDIAMMAEGVRKENAELLAIALERKLKEKGETLELDENDNIKGWKDKLEGLKTQFPTMFESKDTSGFKVLGDNKLPEGDKGPVTVTKEQFAKMGYDERLKLKNENEQLYKQLTAK